MGSGIVTPVIAPNSNFTITPANGSWSITQATPTATLAVSNSPQTYTGSAIAASVGISASSVPGTVSNVKYNGSSTVPTNADTYTVTADFVPNDTINYATLTSLSAGSFTIDPAESVTEVSCSAGPFTYTGSAITPCTANVTGAGGLNEALTVGYTDNLNAGLATASASYPGDANHTGSNDSKNFTIDPAESITEVSCPANETYTGSAIEPCTANATGAGGLNEVLTVGYTDNFNAGLATASASLSRRCESYGQQ